VNGQTAKLGDTGGGTCDGAEPVLIPGQDAGVQRTVEPASLDLSPRAYSWRYVGRAPGASTGLEVA